MTKTVTTPPNFVEGKAVDTSFRFYPHPVTTRIFQRLYEIKNRGEEPRAIYLGFGYLRELDQSNLNATGKYGERPKVFAGIPTYEVVGDEWHFNVTSSGVEKP